MHRAVAISDAQHLAAVFAQDLTRPEVVVVNVVLGFFAFLQPHHGSGSFVALSLQSAVVHAIVAAIDAYPAAFFFAASRIAVPLNDFAVGQSAMARTKLGVDAQLNGIACGRVWILKR